VSGSGGRWLTVREGGRDTGDRWGGVDGACWWLEAARWWSVTTRQGINDRGVGAGEMA
jgi:hypothetical protein